MALAPIYGSRCFGLTPLRTQGSDGVGTPLRTQGSDGVGGTRGGCGVAYRPTCSPR